MNRVKKELPEEIAERYIRNCCTQKQIDPPVPGYYASDAEGLAERFQGNRNAGETSEGKNSPEGAGDYATDAKCDAGCFSSWLRRFRYSLISNGGNDVPCGNCTACCNSSYFIHIRPEEKEALSRISKQLLFPAPGLPKGNMLLGYFSDGACPLISKDGCILYSDRPKTCRSYDCRIFAATGIVAGGKEKQLANRQVSRWRFIYPTTLDRTLHNAVKTAAVFIQKYRTSLPVGFISENPSMLAVAALRVYKVFVLRSYDSNRSLSRSTIREYVRSVTEENERFHKLSAEYASRRH